MVYAGNIDSGKSGTLDFLVTPWEDGDYSGEVILKYEDAFQKEAAVVVPLEFTSAMAYVADDFSEYEDAYWEEEPAAANPLPAGLLAGIGAGVVVIAAIIIVLINRKRKAKKSDAEMLEDWFKPADPA